MRQISGPRSKKPGAPRKMKFISQELKKRVSEGPINKKGLRAEAMEPEGTLTCPRGAIRRHDEPPATLSMAI